MGLGCVDGEDRGSGRGQSYLIHAQGVVAGKGRAKIREVDSPVGTDCLRLACRLTLTLTPNSVLQFVRWLDSVVANEKSGKKVLIEDFLTKTSVTVSRQTRVRARERIGVG